MTDFILARAIHVSAVVLWIGGVAFVTMVLMPAIRRDIPATGRLATFQRFERSFARIAAASVLVAGASGLWMLWRAQLWSRFTEAQYWWMHAMVVVWAGFALMLFVAEPLFLHRRMSTAADPERAFARMERMHRLALLLSLVTVFGAVLGSHGWEF